MEYNNNIQKGFIMGIESNIGYTFKNKLLLSEALTHTSYANENNVRSNEKLEFQEIVYQNLFLVNIYTLILEI